MNVVYSAGGPFIVLPAEQAPQWGGAKRTTYANTSISDYEAAGMQVSGDYGVPRLAAVLRGARPDALVIASPVETTLIGDSELVIIVQAHYCEDDWDYGSIGSDIMTVAFDLEADKFLAISGTYLLFDSAYCFDQVGDDHLSLNLQAGLYRVRSGFVKPDAKTLLSVVSIERQ